MKKKKDIKTIPLKPELTEAEIEKAETLNKIESWKMYCNHLQNIADDVAKKIKATKVKLEIMKLENELFRLRTEIEAKTRFYMHYIQRVIDQEPNQDIEVNLELDKVSTIEIGKKTGKIYSHKQK